MSRSRKERNSGESGDLSRKTQVSQSTEEFDFDDLKKTPEQVRAEEALQQQRKITIVTLAIGGLATTAGLIAVGVAINSRGETNQQKSLIEATLTAWNSRTPQVLQVPVNVFITAEPSETRTPTLTPTNDMTQTADTFNATLTAFPLTLDAIHAQLTESPTPTQTAIILPTGEKIYIPATITPDLQKTIDYQNILLTEPPKPSETFVPSPTNIPPTIPPTATESPKPSETPTLTLVVQPTAENNNLTPRKITRYQAQGLLQTEKHELSPFSSDPNKEANETQLRSIRDNVINDLEILKAKTESGEITVEQFADFAELILPGAGRLGVSPDKLIDSLKQETVLKGDLNKDSKMIWKSANGQKTFALANLYDENKKGETQVLTAITHASRARQVFRAMASTTSLATGKDANQLRATIEANLGYTSLDGDPGSEFTIACWRTYTKVENPVWGNFRYQKAQYDNSVGVGNAHEADGIEDGKGLMQVDSNETIFIVVKVNPNGTIFGDDVTDTSTTLVDYNGRRDTKHGNGDNWKPCGPAPTKIPEKPKPQPQVVQQQQQPSNPQPGPTTPPEVKTEVPPTPVQPTPPIPTPVPTNPGRDIIPTATPS